MYFLNGTFNFAFFGVNLYVDSILRELYTIYHKSLIITLNKHNGKENYKNIYY